MSSSCDSSLSPASLLAPPLGVKRVATCPAMAGLASRYSSSMSSSSGYGRTYAAGRESYAGCATCGIRVYSDAAGVIYAARGGGIAEGSGRGFYGYCSTVSGLGPWRRMGPEVYVGLVEEWYRYQGGVVRVRMGGSPCTPCAGPSDGPSESPKDAGGSGYAIAPGRGGSPSIGARGGNPLGRSGAPGGAGKGPAGAPRGPTCSPVGPSGGPRGRAGEASGGYRGGGAPVGGIPEGGPRRGEGAPAGGGRVGG